jgi:hypothetical protein
MKSATAMPKPGDRRTHPKFGSRRSSSVIFAYYRQNQRSHPGRRSVPSKFLPDNEKLFAAIVAARR